MVRTIDDGDRHTPVALAGDQPIAQPVDDGAFADATAFGLSDDLCNAVFHAESAIGTGVDQEAVIGLERGLESSGGLLRGRADDFTNRQLIFLRELEVTRIVGR